MVPNDPFDPRVDFVIVIYDEIGGHLSGEVVGWAVFVVVIHDEIGGELREANDGVTPT